MAYPDAGGLFAPAEFFTQILKGKLGAAVDSLAFEGRLSTAIDVFATEHSLFERRQVDHLVVL